jgi:hypothetical protein
LHFGDGRRAFKRRVVAGPDAHQHDVVVIVDEARHHCATAQVDLARARAQALAAAGSDGGDPPVLDRDLGRGGSGTVHRDEAAVGQPQITRTCAGIRTRGLPEECGR